MSKINHEEYTDGSIYIGEFTHEKRHGRGTMTWINNTGPMGCYKYAGTWNDDKMHGHGTIYWKKGETHANYKGKFDNNKISFEMGVFTKKMPILKFLDNTICEYIRDDRGDISISKTGDPFLIELSDKIKVYESSLTDGGHILKYSATSSPIDIPIKNTGGGKRGRKHTKKRNRSKKLIR